MEEETMENQVEQPNLEQTPVAVEEKKPNIGLLIVMSLIVISLIAGGVYAGIQIGKKQTPTSIPTQMPAPTLVVVSPTNASDETANWKTYTNQEYQFSFKYPNTWIDIVTTEEKTRGNSGYTNRSFIIETSNKEYISGTVFDGKAQHTNDSDTVVNFDLKNDKSLLVTYVKCMGSGCKFGVKDIETFKQILSTFKFLE